MVSAESTMLVQAWSTCHYLKYARMLVCLWQVSLWQVSTAFAWKDLQHESETLLRFQADPSRFVSKSPFRRLSKIVLGEKAEHVAIYTILIAKEDLMFPAEQLGNFGISLFAGKKLPNDSSFWGRDDLTFENCFSWLNWPCFHNENGHGMIRLWCFELLRPCQVSLALSGTKGETLGFDLVL